MQGAFDGDADFEHGIMQLIMDQVEELIVTLIEEVRERPGVAAAILAAIVGALIGSVLARRGHKTSPPAKMVRRARGMGDFGELAGLGLKLLENPIVRTYIRAAVSGQLKKRFSR